MAERWDELVREVYRQEEKMERLEEENRRLKGKVTELLGEKARLEEAKDALGTEARELRKEAKVKGKKLREVEVRSRNKVRRYQSDLHRKQKQLERAGRAEKEGEESSRDLLKERVDTLEWIIRRMGEETNVKVDGIIELTEICTETDRLLVDQLALALNSETRERERRSG